MGKRWVLDIKAACERARASVSGSEIARQTGLDDRWLFAKTYFDRLAQRASEEIVPKWVNRLGGVRAFTVDHCSAMLMGLAHEWGLEGSE